MKVSILLPYYNDRKFLRTAIDSILASSFQDFELILINHATTDECREIAHSYNDPRIVNVDMEKNYEAGGGLIILKFLEYAKGQYLKLICADDILYPDGLKILVDYMDTHPDKDFAFGNVEYIDIDGRPKNKDFFNHRKKFSLSNNEMDCLKLFSEGVSFLPYIGSIIKKEVLENAYIDKSLIHLMDMMLWASMLAKGYKIGFVNEIIAGYRIHEGQSSSTTKVQTTLQTVKFEFCKYIDLFVNIKDANILKQIFSDNIYLQKYNNFSDLDLKFIVCYQYLTSNNTYYRLAAYSYIHDMLQDSNIAKHLEEKFNFSVKEFRHIYTTFSLDEHINYNQLSVKELLYLLLKKVIKKITCSKMRNRSNQAESL